MKAGVEGLAEAGDRELERLERANSALEGARPLIAHAARVTAAERDEGAKVLAAAIARVVRESRHDGIGERDVPRFKTALAGAAATLRSRNAEAAASLAMARQLDLLAQASGRQSALLRQARAHLSGRQAGLQASLIEAETALSRIPEAAAEPPSASDPPPPAGNPLSADPDPAVAWSSTDPEPPAPAAGPAQPSAADGDPAHADELEDLALLAPEAEVGTLPSDVPSDPVVTKGWPIAGGISGAFGDEGNGPRDRGLTFVSDLTQPVRAPRGGNVVFAGPFLGFGLLLIVDHGDEYHSLLAGAARLDVRVGDVVVAGQIVGSIDGSEAEPARLYLELRHNGRPINPLPWLAAREDKVRG